MKTFWKDWSLILPVAGALGLATACIPGDAPVPTAEGSGTGALVEAATAVAPEGAQAAGPAEAAHAADELAALGEALAERLDRAEAAVEAAGAQAAGAANPAEGDPVAAGSAVADFPLEPDGSIRLVEIAPTYSLRCVAPAVVVPIRAIREQIQAQCSRNREEGVEVERSNDVDSFDVDDGNNVWSVRWSVVADTSRWLELKADWYSYEGGAHGDYGVTTLHWDRAAGALRDLKDLTDSLDALDAALKGDFCERLEAQVQEREGGSMRDFVDECPSPVEFATSWISGDGERIRAFIIHVPPGYVSSWASGAYEIEVPVSAAVYEALSESVRDGFSVAASDSP